MAANINDKITAAKNSVNPTVTTVSVARLTGVTTLTIADATGWPTVSAVEFATYKVDVNNKKIAGSQVDWKATLSGSVLGNLTRVGGAADTGNAIGDIAQMMPTATWGHDLYQALTKEHDQLDGTHRLTQLVDTNNNEFVKFAQVASAVNELSITNAATGTAPILSATGGDTNVDINLTPKGTGIVNLNYSGASVQAVSSAFNGSTTTTTQIPFDNTIPQITEGAEFMTLAITPKNATNILVIEVICLLSSDTASRNLSAALFQDATANALAASSEFTDDSAALIPRAVTFTHRMVAGTTSSTTFRVRGGANNTGTTTFNGFNGGGVFGAITKSSIVISEYKA